MGTRLSYARRQGFDRGCCCDDGRPPFRRTCQAGLCRYVRLRQRSDPGDGRGLPLQYRPVYATVLADRGVRISPTTSRSARCCGSVVAGRSMSHHTHPASRTQQTPTETGSRQKGPQQKPSAKGTGFDVPDQAYCSPAAIARLCLLSRAKSGERVESRVSLRVTCRISTEPGVRPEMQVLRGHLPHDVSFNERRVQWLLRLYRARESCQHPYKDGTYHLVLSSPRIIAGSTRPLGH